MLETYVGQTTHSFRYCWNNYKGNAENFNVLSCKQEHWFQHFSSPEYEGVLNDVSIIYILTKRTLQVPLNVNVSGKKPF